VCYGLEAITAAYCGDLQMKARMPWMAAVVDEIFRRFFRGSNLGKDSIGGVIFSKMGAQTTLTFMHLQHYSKYLLPLDCGAAKCVSIEKSRFKIPFSLVFFLHPSCH
jgi:hypothetical protein